MKASDALDPAFESLLRELADAVIEYTPQHFREIECTIRTTGSAESLRYHISCPEFPNEATEQESEPIRNVATAIARFWSSTGEAFPGVRLVCKLENGSEWQTTLEPLKT